MKESRRTVQIVPFEHGVPPGWACDRPNKYPIKPPLRLTLDSQSRQEFLNLELIRTARFSLSLSLSLPLLPSLAWLSPTRTIPPAPRTMLNFRRKKSGESDASAQHDASAAVDAPRQPFRKAIVPVIACGAGLFSDGYINNVSAPTCAVRSAHSWLPNLACIRQDFGCRWRRSKKKLGCLVSMLITGVQVIGSVTTVLGLQYGDLYKNSNAKKYVSDIAFAGTVVGQLAFGWLADHWSRTNSLLVSTVILMVFTALAAGSYYRGEAVGMFNMLAAWRFFVSSITHLPPLGPTVLLGCL